MSALAPISAKPEPSHRAMRGKTGPHPDIVTKLTRGPSVTTSNLPRSQASNPIAAESTSLRSRRTVIFRTQCACRLPLRLGEGGQNDACCTLLTSYRRPGGVHRATTALTDVR